MESIEYYIDFDKMWEDLKNDYTDCFDCIDDKRIVEFIKNNDIPLYKDECELGITSVTFNFGLDFDDANESNPQSSWLIVWLEYDFIKEEFIRYEQEQG